MADNLSKGIAIVITLLIGIALIEHFKSVNIESSKSQTKPIATTTLNNVAVNSVPLRQTIQELPILKKLPIGIENFPPFEYEKDEKVTGFDTEIVEQVLQRIGYTPQIQVIPWTRAQELTTSGALAAIYSLAKSPERERVYYFSDPLSTVKDVFFKRKEKNIVWNTLGDLKEYRIGISGGYSYAPILMSAIESKLLRTESLYGDSPEYRQLLKLESGYIDLCVCELSVGQYLIQKHAPKFEMLDFIDKPIGEIRTYHMGVSKNWPGAKELIENFNVELAKFVAEGKRKAIFDRYGITCPLEK